MPDYVAGAYRQWEKEIGSLVEVEHLVKFYGEKEALTDVSFSIPEGQVVGLLGLNGAGKSTTMNILTGYLSATAGTVRIDGHDILTDANAAKRNIGYLPEQFSFYPEMRVNEYLDFCCDLKGVTKDRKQRQAHVRQIVARVGLTKVYTRMIRNLSKGYKQRVGFAQALIGSPKLLILDEPTVGLDPSQIIEIRELIRKLAKKHTVILSSHILAEVREVCDYIMIISKGKLVASDTPENLERYLGESGLIEIETRTEASKVKEVLKNVPGIEKVSLKIDASGITSGQIREKRGQDIREELFTTFAEKKMPLLKLNPVQVSLEDVFMELTQSDKAAEEFARKAKEAEKEEVSNAGDL